MKYLSSFCVFGLIFLMWELVNNFWFDIIDVIMSLLINDKGFFFFLIWGLVVLLK